MCAEFLKGLASIGSWLFCGSWSVFLHVSGNEQQRKNLPPALPSLWPRKGPVGALGTSAPGSSRDRILVGTGGLWLPGLPELSALVISLGYEPINLLPTTWVQCWPRGLLAFPILIWCQWSLPLGGCVLPNLCVLLKMEIFKAPVVPAFRIPRHKGLSVEGQPWLYRETVSREFR